MFIKENVDKIKFVEKNYTNVPKSKAKLEFELVTSRTQANPNKVCNLRACFYFVVFPIDFSLLFFHYRC